MEQIFEVKLERKSVGGFCCPVPPKPLESVLLPGRSNRALAL